MIQIDMQMPEKCGDCIFCDDNCSCVASDYNGTGINVGCAYRTGRRDIRCPLKEQEEKQTPKPIIHGDKEEYWGEEEICPVCGKRWQSANIDSTHFCPGCGQAVIWENT